MLRGGRGGDHAVEASGNPAVKIIVIGKAADVDGSIVSGTHGKRLALRERGGLVFAQDGNLALENIHRTAVVEIVDAETGAASGLDGKVSAGHAEVVSIRGIDVKGRGTLTQYQASGLGAIFQGEIVELENGVLGEKGHGAVLKFNLGAALVGGQDVALANGQIELGSFPGGIGIGERVALNVACKAHIALDEAQADDPCVTGIREGRMGGGKKQGKEAQ